jgi:hypothetical protein
MSDWDTRHEWSYENVRERIQMFVAEFPIWFAGTALIALLLLIAVILLIA